MNHRWSGWPGAYCLDCGAPDPFEVCLAEHGVMDFICLKCDEQWSLGECPAGGEHYTEEIVCFEHQPTECTGGTE